MLLGDNRVDDDVRLIDLDVRLIDLELAGPNYRGFDLAKLFRIDPYRFSEERFSEFLSVYCETAKVDESLAKEIEKDESLLASGAFGSCRVLCPGGGNGSGFWWSEQ